MRHPVLILFITLLSLAMAGCGFHPRGTTQVPRELRTLILSSSDPYGPLARTVREQLRLNDIKVLDPTAITTRTDIPTLRLLSAPEGRDTASVFQNGVAAEYSLMMTINAEVLIPNKGIYPISTTVYRSFFDNPLAALAKDSEQEIIRREMLRRAAEQLTRKLLTVHTAQKNDGAMLPAPETVASREASPEVSPASAAGLQ